MHLRYVLLCISAASLLAIAGASTAFADDTGAIEDPNQIAATQFSAPPKPKSTFWTIEYTYPDTIWDGSGGEAGNGAGDGAGGAGGAGGGAGGSGGGGGGGSGGGGGGGGSDGEGD